MKYLLFLIPFSCLAQTQKPAHWVKIRDIAVNHTVDEWAMVEDDIPIPKTGIIHDSVYFICDLCKHLLVRPGDSVKAMANVPAPEVSDEFEIFPDAPTKDGWQKIVRKRTVRTVIKTTNGRITSVKADTSQAKYDTTYSNKAEKNLGKKKPLATLLNFPKNIPPHQAPTVSTKDGSWISETKKHKP